MRLIDADALYIEIMDRGIDGLQLDDLSEIQQVIADAPTAAEVVPIVRGKWIKMTGMMPPEYHGHYECSLCGWHGDRHTKEREYRYCPNCGAKME